MPQTPVQTKVLYFMKGLLKSNPTSDIVCRSERRIRKVKISSTCLHVIFFLLINLDRDGRDTASY
jgi:hypothetical protein